MDLRRPTVERRDILVAIIRGIERADEVLALCRASPSTDQLAIDLATLLDVDRNGARAVLDTQVRRHTPESLRGLRAELAEIELECVLRGWA